MKLILSIFITLLSYSSFADKLISCKTVDRNPQVVLEFLAKETQSKRLSSSLFYTLNGITGEYTPATIAQYAFDEKAVYVLSDNSSGIPVLRLAVVKDRALYKGYITSFDQAGIAIKNIKVGCSLLNP